MVGGRTVKRGLLALATMALAAGVGLAAQPAAAGSSQLLLASFEGGQDALQFDVARLPKWQRISEWLATPQEAAADPALRPWATWAAGLRGMAVSARLDAINQRVNSTIRYATDMEVWGVRDYWETPSEVVAQGRTDCEGYAIMKLWLARAAGLDAGDLELLVGILPRTGQMHAVLVAADVDGPKVLDMLHPEVMNASAFTDFRPIVAASQQSLQLFVGALGGGAAMLASK
jgi:predicted transglutaminase-like cysteine proteinase